MRTVEFLLRAVGVTVRIMMSEAIQPKRVRIPHLQAAKEHGERIVMLTAYDYLTAQVFDEAGIDLLLVGDSVGDKLLGNETTLPVILDEFITLTRGVQSGTRSAIEVADLLYV